jgi:tRNA(fMet)-specific endonuclease VapC
VYVLDTNTLIYFFKGQGEVAKNLMSVSPNAVGIPAIVIFELQYGIARSSLPRKRAAQLEEMTSVVRVLPFADAAAKASALLRAQLAKKGTPIGPYDVLIAGTALAHEAVLVTNNKQEFKRVPKLKMENWF